VKLAGIRVLDLSVFLPGPYLTRTLADHGAEVIKVEAPPDGDPGRHIGLSQDSSTVFFRNLNRGKKSIVLNLKDATDQAILLDLCATADIFVESFRPGVAERLGIGYEAVRARNSRIIYCSITAFGQSGPYRDRAAHDLAVEALSGVLSVTLGRDGQPAIPGIPVSDYLSAILGLAGVLMALHRRHTTGEGDYVDISMHDAMASACANILGPTLAEDRQPVARHERTTGGSALYQIYETGDGRHICLAGQELKFARTLLEALGRGDLIALCARGPGPHQQPVESFLRETFLQKTRDDWVEWLGKLDVCFGSLKTLPEALRDEQLLARGMVQKDALGRRHLASPIRFSAEPAQIDYREPDLDANRSEILKSLRM